MPRLDKETFSRYLRSNCERQLRLYMYRKDSQASERKQQVPPVPDPQPPRPGLAHIRDAGDAWAEEKLGDLHDTLPADSLVGNAHKKSNGRWAYREMPLAQALAQAKSRVPATVDGCFLVESEYQVGASFKTALGIAHLEHQHGLEYSDLRTDLIEVTGPSQTVTQYLSVDGSVRPLPTGDTRLRLAVSEIKLQSEPSASYFAEVVFYAMALAGWLEDNQLSKDFVVVPDSSFIWKGSTSQSALRRCLQEYQRAGTSPTYGALRRALESDVEDVPYPVFVPRVRNFFANDLPNALAKPDWTDLDWHVDRRCSGCVFAGFPWNGKLDEHCIPAAEREGHLSRIAYVSRGASEALRQGGVVDIPSLAGLSASDSAFDGHQALRATRTVIADRVKALQNGQAAGLAADSGTSAVLPKYADLKFFISVDFDPSSAVSISFGLKADWREPYARHQEREQAAGNPVSWESERWRPDVWVVESKDDPAHEEKALLAFLDRINEISEEAKRRDGGSNRTTVQFYLWDQLELKHFSRVIGRHLEAVLANADVSRLAWLFPSDVVLENPQQVSRRSPLTVVSDVVRAVLAAPISHVYSLLPIARAYHPAWRGSTPEPTWWGKYSVHPLFEDPFSDQIPAERIHEIWSRSTNPSWGQRQKELLEAVQRRLDALDGVTSQLTEDLSPILTSNAPPLNLGALKPLSRVGFDGQLWYAFAKLNAALDELEVHRTRAMPSHEREARFRSALLDRRLSGKEEKSALDVLGLGAAPRRRVYQLGDKSREVRFRPGDFNVALSPLGRPNFLDERFGTLAAGTSLGSAVDKSNAWTRMEDMSSVRIAALDREKGLIALDPGSFRHPEMLDRLDATGVVDFSRDVMLDPVPKDFFTSRLGDTLRAIGNPQGAAVNPLTPRVRQATGQSGRRGARPSPDTPVSEVLWGALGLHSDVQARSLGSFRPLLAQEGIRLNDSQWAALDDSLQRHLGLIWGPPGTGKSQTVRALLIVAMLDAAASGSSLRILLSAGTYAAVDNVLLRVQDDAQRLLPTGTDLQVHRLRSSAREQPEDPRTQAVDLAVNRRNPSSELIELRTRLRDRVGITLVAATPQQAHALLTTDDGEDSSPQQEFFDLIALDEASQLDVAQSILSLAGRASNGRVVVAGDDLQLAPIHQADPPRDLDSMVGSVYSFIAGHHGVPPRALEVNYRSNQTIVDFARHAGYPPSLHPRSPDLKLQLQGSGRPTNWPASLYWTDDWEALLEPDQPTTSFIYPDAFWSAQSNAFEADAVASVVYLLRVRQLDALANDLIQGASGNPTAYDDEGFWTDGVGVVTPHRAQQALIIARLQAIFPNTDPTLIRNAVDTVERFQGQQREVIIASYALGDPDAIRDEDEFLMSKNRFNVMASRARAKFIVLVSQAVVDHLSGDIDVLRGSGLLKTYVTTYCSNVRPVELGCMDGQQPRRVLGHLRWA